MTGVRMIKPGQTNADPVIFGAGSGGRTHTVLLPADFESAKSSYSIISGKPVKVCYYAKESTFATMPIDNTIVMMALCRLNLFAISA